MPKVTQSQNGRTGVALGQSDSRVSAPNSSPRLALIWWLPALGGGRLTKQHREKGFKFASSKGENKKILFPSCLNKRKELQFDP